MLIKNFVGINNSETFTNQQRNFFQVIKTLSYLKKEKTFELKRKNFSKFFNEKNSRKFIFIFEPSFTKKRVNHLSNKKRFLRHPLSSRIKSPSNFDTSCTCRPSKCSLFFGEKFRNSFSFDYSSHPRGSYIIRASGKRNMFHQEAGENFSAM